MMTSRPLIRARVASFADSARKYGYCPFAISSLARVYRRHFVEEVHDLRFPLKHCP